MSFLQFKTLTLPALLRLTMAIKDYCFP